MNHQDRYREDLFGLAFHADPTRRAGESGVLRDVTRAARKFGFLTQVSMTRAAWAFAVEWDDEHGLGQVERLRLDDVLHAAAQRVECGKRRREQNESAEFAFDRVPNIPDAEYEEMVFLKITAHRGEHEQPMITIMRPDED